jgi:hypothetical protein
LSKKILVILGTLILLCSLIHAQIRTGNIYGKIVDTEGNPLPGVTVTLTGALTAPVTVITSVEGAFRFMALPPAKDYVIKAELKGFKTLIRENIIVVVGKNTELTLVMEIGKIEEEITVIAATPVVQTKKTSVVENVTRDVLQSLPTARDPWVVLQQAPGIMVDRENIGGSESGQQSGFFAKGGGYDQWSLDGVVITDPAAVASPTYYDFDAFEEINITTGGQDVTIQGGGVSINLVTRRGGNRVSFGGRFYLVDSKFQASHTGPKIDEILSLHPTWKGYNVIRNIKDYGFNMGGPFIKDKAWWWMSFGVQDIKTNIITGAADDTLLQNYAAKINFQLIPENRFEAFTHIGNKEKWGRSSSPVFPRGWHQTGKYHFGSPIYKIQDEHMFGDNLFISLKYSFNDAGFNLIPMEDEEQNRLLRYDVDNNVYRDSFYAYNASRPSHSVYFQLNYFADELFGASHEVKAGFDFRHSTGTHYWSSSGNVRLDYNYGNRPTVDITGDNVPDVVPGIQRVVTWRGWRDNNSVVQYAGYFSDTISVGRFNFLLGFRYDYQAPRVSAFTKTAVEPDNGAWKNNFTSTTINAIDRFLPGLNIPEIKPDWAMKTFSPRIGITYDVFGDGKTIAKLNLARYGEFMHTGWADYFLPTYTGGWAVFWWLDANGNGIVDVTELYWLYVGDYSLHQVFDSGGNIIANIPAAEWWSWGGFDPTNPQKTGKPQYTLDPSVGSYYINEVIFTIERELLPDFGVALDLTYRRLDNYNWTLQWDGSDKNTIRSQDDYTAVGTIPNQVGPYPTKDAAGRPYYLRKAGVPNYYYRYVTERPDYYKDYMGVEVRFNKRLSNRWMLNGSFTLQTEKVHFGKKGYLNPTNIWALDGREYAQYMGGGSGKVSQYVFSRWLFKLSGLYQLPWDINVSFTFNAREGHVLRERVRIVDYNAPNPLERSIWVYLTPFGTHRLPTFWNLNLRFEKVVRCGETGRIYIMADIFNLFNQSIVNRRYQMDHGTYYVHSGAFVQSATDGLINELLNPRVVRLGVRFEF